MFTIRVYGILINDKNQVLVSDEIIADKLFTKFCGGGLEYGEGTIDCVKREFKEEMNLAIEVNKHFYTTDFFQPSAFKNSDQVLSVYYLIQALETVSEHLFQNEVDIEKIKQSELQQLFRWIDWEDFGPNIFQLTIDKVVAGMIKLQLK